MTDFLNKLNDTQKGIFYMFVSVIITVLAAGIVKGHVDKISSVEIIFFRNLFGIAFIVFSLLKTPFIKQGGRAWLWISRGLLGYISTSLFFYLVQHIPFSNTVVLFQSATLFASVFAFIFLKERLSRLQIFATLVGFIGVVIVIQPSVDFTYYHVLGLSLGVMTGLASVSIRAARNYYSARSLTLSFCIFSVIGTSIGMIVASLMETSRVFDFVVSPFVIPSLNTVGLLIILAIFGVLSRTFGAKALAYSKTGIVGTVSYVGVVLAIFLGVLLGDDFPNMITIVGMGLIVLGGIIVLLNKEK